METPEKTKVPAMQISTKINIITLGFATVHALATLLLRYTYRVDDTYALSILTICMILIIVKINDKPLDIGVAIALILSILGYIVGTKGDELLSMSSISAISYYSNVIASFFTTELLGWITYLTTRKGVSKSKLS